MKQTGYKLIVTETSGIRRFLYPFHVDLPAKFSTIKEKIAVSDSNGNLIPSHTEHGNKKSVCYFATFLTPYEIQELSIVIVDSSEHIPIPDPFSITKTETQFVGSQERIRFEINGMATLNSVVYDGTEHLAAPVSFELNGVPAKPLSPAQSAILSDPTNTLAAHFSAKLLYETQNRVIDAQNSMELTACKSWAKFNHTISNPPANSTLSMTVPLTAHGKTQICDFGVGNGVYGKIQSGAIDAVSWETECGENRSAGNWIVASELTPGGPRIDNMGKLKPGNDSQARQWFHWIDENKSIAVAFDDTDAIFSRRGVTLRADGTILIELSWLGEPNRPLAFSAYFHFLNDLPPIAAATNPASILLKPTVKIVKPKI